MACAFDPTVGADGGRRTIRAPAAEASEAVASVDPSSTTMTSRMYRHCRATATTAATVGSSFRAGMTQSTTS
jgi:hypothetical protein